MGKTRQKYELILKKHFNYDKLKDKQFKIIYNIVHKNRDVSATLSTGFGKSLCYQLPYLITNKSVIVISPLIALMEDQMKELYDRQIDAVCLNSNNTNKGEDMRNILQGEEKIIFMTPEFFVLAKDFISKLEDRLCCVAIDESHCISNWSDDSFRPEYKELKIIKTLLPNIPILTLTATANKKVQIDIIKILQLHKPKIIKGSFNRDNLILHVERKGHHFEKVVKYAHKHKDDFVIVYAKTRKDTEEIARFLRFNKINAQAYHAGMESSKRIQIQDNFMKGVCKCIVATIAFGMGINNKHVRSVIHYGCPKNMDSYYQEIGRAGRDGELSYCYLLYNHNDFRLNNYFISQIENDEFRNYCREESDKMKYFSVNTRICRRKMILNHFGEETDITNCSKCDICLSSVKKVDCTEESKIVLDLLSEIERNYGITIICLILRGSNAKKITPYMKSLKSYRKGIEYKDKWWKDLIRLLIEYKYIEEEFFGKKNASVIKITKLGIDMLKHNKQILLPLTPYLKQNKPINKFNLKDLDKSVAEINLLMP